MHKEGKPILTQAALFVATFVTTTIAGSEWCFNKSVFAETYSWEDFSKGLAFSVPLLLILTVHEFGHYFMAIIHKVKTSLPYYIPIPPIPYLPHFGTMGAVIRLRSRPESNIQNFDIGLAGPLAGFIVALLITFYGFMTLPPPEYIFSIHPEYEQYGLDYAEHVYSAEFLNENNVINIKIGSNGLFWLFSHLVDDPAKIPDPHELMHYPVLFACYFALFVTCLNLLPIGQLDGGHIVYGLFGFRRHKKVAVAFFLVMMFYAGLGLPYINPVLPINTLLVGIAGYLLFLFLSFAGLRWPVNRTILAAALMFGIQFALMWLVPGIKGFEGWLLFVFVVGRFIGIEHPPSEIETPLDRKRIVLGWIALLIFVLCFSPAPIQIEIP